MFDRRLLLLILLASLPAVPATFAQAPPGQSAVDALPTEPALRQALMASPALRRDERRWRESLGAMYTRRAWLPLWSSVAGPSPGALALLGMLYNAASFGLDTRDYDVTVLAARVQALSVAASAATVTARCEFDSALSIAAARFISDLHSGRIAPRAVGHDLDVPHAALDVGTAIAAAASSTDVAGVIADFEPAFHHYDLLKQALARYRVLATDPSLTQLPPLPARSVKPGQTYAGATELRRLLRALGDLPDAASSTSVDAIAGTAAAAAAAAANAPDTLLDETLMAGLRSFQDRHGLNADGALGAGTFAALTTPLNVRVRQIELSLERSRWLPPQLDSPPILVNIPQFRLFGFYTTSDREDLLLQMNVIVGKTFTRNNTPVFAADMRFVVIRPYWDVPATIVRAEFMPKIRANPDWLTRNGFEIVSGDSDESAVLSVTPQSIDALARGALRLRQRPGEDNSLGVAKLMFPNRHNVYLHGTPAQGLFAATRRAFSHGCVRVEDPLGLAAFVLRDQPQWTRAKLEELAQLDHPTRIPVSQPIRVFILYATAMATESGRVLFFEDIYGHDRKLDALLTRQAL